MSVSVWLDVSISGIQSHQWFSFPFLVFFLFFQCSIAANVVPGHDDAVVFFQGKVLPHCCPPWNLKGLLMVSMRPPGPTKTKTKRTSPSKLHHCYLIRPYWSVLISGVILGTFDVDSDRRAPKLGLWSNHGDSFTFLTTDYVIKKLRMVGWVWHPWNFIFFLVL